MKLTPMIDRRTTALGTGRETSTFSESESLCECGPPALHNCSGRALLGTESMGESSVSRTSTSPSVGAIKDG